MGLVAFQAILIYKLTKKYAEAKKALTPDEMKAALKTGGVVAIGPAISVFVLALSMISLLGAHRAYGEEDHGKKLRIHSS